MMERRSSLDARVKSGERFGIAFGEAQPLLRGEAEELTDLRAIHADPEHGLGAQRLPHCAEEAIERVDPKRKRAQLDPCDRRLRDPGKPGELALRKPGPAPRPSEEASRVHPSTIADLLSR